MPEPIRAFIAIELPPEVKAELTRIQSRLRSACGASARWVDSNGIHLTLKFLGDVPRDRLEAIVRTMSEAAQGCPPFFYPYRGAAASRTRAARRWSGQA